MKSPQAERNGRQKSEAVQALRTKHPLKYLLYSDQGVPYRTEACRRTLANHEIVQSMSRKGNCWDNVPMEASLRY